MRHNASEQRKKIFSTVSIINSKLCFLDYFKSLSCAKVNEEKDRKMFPDVERVEMNELRFGERFVEINLLIHQRTSLEIKIYLNMLIFN